MKYIIFWTIYSFTSTVCPESQPCAVLHLRRDGSDHHIVFHSADSALRFYNERLKEKEQTKDFILGYVIDNIKIDSIKQADPE